MEVKQPSDSLVKHTTLTFNPYKKFIPEKGSEGFYKRSIPLPD
jgi:hypothetical protein